MEKIKYRDLIMQYLTALEPDQTITTEQVAQYVAERLLLDAAMVKKTVNVNMARLEKEGQIMRLTKGIYCRRVKTAFGYYTPDKETLFCKQLLRKENEIIGYIETGIHRDDPQQSRSFISIDFSPGLHGYHLQWRNIGVFKTH